MENKYKDMGNTELLQLFVRTIRREESGRLHGYFHDTELEIIDEIMNEVLSRMIPRESIKLTVK